MEARDALSAEPVVAGYASVFGVEYDVWDWLGKYTEEVAPQAFSKNLAEGPDVRMFYNHDGLVLARTKSGTLDLQEDGIGLAYEGRMDGRVSAARDLALTIERGNVDQSSFMFEIVRQEWNEDYTKRWIREVRLWDVSPVAFPASESTTSGLRMRDVLEALRSVDPSVIGAELRGGRADRELLIDVLHRITDVPDIRAMMDAGGEDEAAEDEQEVTDLDALLAQVQAIEAQVSKMIADEAEDTPAASSTMPAESAERDEGGTLDADTARRLTQMFALREPA
jgi:HK97 family phage prohead protease